MAYIVMASSSSQTHLHSYGLYSDGLYSCGTEVSLLCHNNLDPVPIAQLASHCVGAVDDLVLLGLRPVDVPHLTSHRRQVGPTAINAEPSNTEQTVFFYLEVVTDRRFTRVHTRPLPVVRIHDPHHQHHPVVSAAGLKHATTSTTTRRCHL